MLLEVLNRNLKYNPRQRCLGTLHPAHCSNFWRSSEEATTEGGKVELDSPPTLLLVIFLPYFSNWPPAKTSQRSFISPEQWPSQNVLPTSFWQSHSWQNLIKARVIALVMTWLLSLSVVLCCVAAKHEKCEICLAGFPANDGVNFSQMMARICANCWLSHFQLNRCVKTTGFSSYSYTPWRAEHKNSYKCNSHFPILHSFTDWASSQKHTYIRTAQVYNGLCTHKPDTFTVYATRTHLSTLINFSLLANELSCINLCWWVHTQKL